MLGVDAFGWDDFDAVLTIGVGAHVGVPFAVVEQMVVVEAEQGPVGHVGGSVM